VLKNIRVRFAVLKICVFWDVTLVAREVVSTFSNDGSLFFFSFKRS